MKRTTVVFLILLLCAAATVSCERRRACTPEELVYPDVSFPESYDFVDSLRPTFYWEYPDPTCRPSGYNVYIDELSYTVDSEETYTNLGGARLDRAADNWTPSYSLQPARAYMFEIQAMSGVMPGPGIGIYFFTGPICGDSELTTPVQGLPRDGARLEAPFLLTWEFTSGCLPKGFDLQLDTDPTFASPYDTHLGGNVLNWYQIADNWRDYETCRTFYWRVASENRSAGSTATSPFSPTRSFLIIGDACRLATPMVFVVTMDASCRSGPHTLLYPVLDFVKAGTQLPVQGRSQDSSWFVVQLSDGRSCWISDAVGDLQGDPSLIGIIEPQPPSPTQATDTPLPSGPQPFNCAQYNGNQTACLKWSNFCTWEDKGALCKNR